MSRKTILVTGAAGFIGFHVAQRLLQGGHQVVGLDSLSFTQSAEALVMLVLGGTGSLFGALSGTVIFMLFEDYVSAANPFHWLTMIGALLIAVVLFAPKGLYGTAAAFVARRKEARP